MTGIYSLTHRSFGHVFWCNPKRHWENILYDIHGIWWHGYNLWGTFQWRMVLIVISCSVGCMMLKEQTLVELPGLVKQWIDIIKTFRLALTSRHYHKFSLKRKCHRLSIYSNGEYLERGIAIYCMNIISTHIFLFLRLWYFKMRILPKVSLSGSKECLMPQYIPLQLNTTVTYQEQVLLHLTGGVLPFLSY